jgi:hypothetical protein
VDGATGSRGHVSSAFPRVTSHTPTPIIAQRSVNTLPREAVTSRNRRACATTVARQAVNTAFTQQWKRCGFSAERLRVYKGDQNA